MKHEARRYVLSKRQVGLATWLHVAELGHKTLNAGKPALNSGYRWCRSPGSNRDARKGGGF